MFAKIISSFLRREDGAVTVDWVVLTAAVVGLAILVVTPVVTGTGSMSQKATAYITAVPVGNE